MQGNIGIYRYVNKQNGKSYIGQSSDLHHRHNEHLSSLRRGVDGCKLLQRAWDKYGESNFDYEVICICDIEELDALEIKYITEFDSYHNGYNCNKGGSGNSGFKHSDKTKKRIGLSLQGRTLSDETRQRMSTAQQGRAVSERHRKALSDAWTPERKSALSMTRSGVNNPNYGRVGKDACNTLPIISNFGDFFFTAAEAAQWCGLKTPTNISSCVNGRRNTAGRHPVTNQPLIWRKATNIEIQLHT